MTFTCSATLVSIITCFPPGLLNMLPPIQKPRCFNHRTYQFWKSRQGLGETVTTLMRSTCCSLCLLGPVGCSYHLFHSTIRCCSKQSVLRTETLATYTQGAGRQNEGIMTRFSTWLTIGSGIPAVNSGGSTRGELGVRPTWSLGHDALIRIRAASECLAC